MMSNATVPSIHTRTAIGVSVIIRKRYAQYHLLPFNLLILTQQSVFASVRARQPWWRLPHKPDSRRADAFPSVAANSSDASSNVQYSKQIALHANLARAYLPISQCRHPNRFTQRRCTFERIYDFDRGGMVSELFEEVCGLGG